MKKLLLFILLFGVSVTSYARNDGGENGAGCINNCGNKHEEGTTNGGSGGQGGAASSIGGTATGVGGSSTATGTVTGTQANNQSTNINFESGDYSSTYDGYVAAAIAPPLVATGDCLGSASAGGSSSVMGFAIGKTYVDEGCNARMDSRHLWSMGLKEEATLRLCSQPAMVKVLGDRCPAPSTTASEDSGRWWSE